MPAEAFAGFGLVLVALVGVIEVRAGFVVAALAPGLADDAGNARARGEHRRASPLPSIVGVTLASFVAALLNHQPRFARRRSRRSWSTGP